jgi:hypothetical protein
MKTIYQKLLTIQQRVNGLGKDKATYNYKYVTGDKLLGEVKPMMNELGLLLKQEVLSIENTRQDYVTKAGNKSEILSKVMMKFTWIDTESGEKDENLFGANGQNDWEKGLGSALTYAERYFLLKYFHIATDEDDIDNDKRVTTPAVPIVEPVKIDIERLEKRLEACVDVANLETTYKSLSPAEQKAIAGFTIKLKEKLTNKTAA